MDKETQEIIEKINQIENTEQLYRIKDALEKRRGELITRFMMK